MKKIILTTVTSCLFTLGGCVTTDIMNNNFTAISSQPVSQELASTWTGSMTSWLVTYIIQKNGDGIYCYSSPTKNGIQRVKYKDNKLFIQDGTKLEIQNITDTKITVQAPYFNVSAHTLYKDTALSKASLFCKKLLNE